MINMLVALLLIFLTPFSVGAARSGQESDTRAGRLTPRQLFDAEQAVEQGKRTYEAGEWETAAAYFKRALELEPESKDAHLWLGMTYASQFVPGSPSEENKEVARASIREMEKVLEADPQNATALLYLSQLYFGLTVGAADWNERQLFEKSKQYRWHLTKVDPDNPEHYYAIGVIDWTLSFRPRMEKKRNLGLLPDQPLPEIDRAELAEQSEAVVNEGIRALEYALSLKPEYSDAIAYLHLMYREKADLVPTQRESNELLLKAEELFQEFQRLRREQVQEPQNP